MDILNKARELGETSRKARNALYRVQDVLDGVPVVTMALESVLDDAEGRLLIGRLFGLSSVAFIEQTNRRTQRSLEEVSHGS